MERLTKLHGIRWIDAMHVMFLAVGWILPAWGADAAVDATRTELANRSMAMDQSRSVVLRGNSDWLFLSRELAHYGSSFDYWREAPANAGGGSSPLEVITAFRDNIAKAGVQLILVPVPGKVVFHAAELVPPLPVPNGVRIDQQDANLLDELGRRGVTVVDLSAVFWRLEQRGIEPFCRQDSHFSPQGQEAAAAAVADLLRGSAWFAGIAKVPVETNRVAVEATGDLARLSTPAGASREHLTVRQVTAEGLHLDAPEFRDRNRESPIVLIGDSHCLVYNGAPELLADHAAFADQLTAETGLLVDVVANLGSGINAPRMELARRKDRLAGKKCVIWLFTARSFTQGPENWKIIPVVR